MEIGGFQLGQQLPGGRFGARWRGNGPGGEDVLLKQMAALKPAAIPPFLETVAGVRGVAHPNLVRTDEPVSDSSGTLWAVEEWVEGVSLGALHQEHVLSTGQALGVARGVLGGLAALHAAGLVHGLVSPTTVMLSLSGEPRLVDVGLWRADPEVAATDEYAAPEVVAADALAPTADVYSLGRVIGEVLQAAPVDPGLASVLSTATDADPRNRPPDAGALLAQLSREAERAYGPLWWTLEGIGGAVASVMGAGVATATATGVAGAGQVGVVSGSLGTGNAAIVAGAEVGPAGIGIVKDAARSGSRLRILVPVIVGVVVIAVAGVAVANSGRQQPETLNAPVPTVSASATASASPTATPTPPAALAFNGTYTYVSVRTKSNDARFPVGEKQTTTWVVTTTCVGQVCTSSADADGTEVPIKETATGWVSDLTFPVDCIRFDTQKKVGSVNYRLVRKLTVTGREDGRITSLSGTSTNRQLKACKIQTIPVTRLAYKVTMTLKK